MINRKRCVYTADKPRFYVSLYVSYFGLNRKRDSFPIVVVPCPININLTWSIWWFTDRNSEGLLWFFLLKNLPTVFDIRKIITFFFIGRHFIEQVPHSYTGYDLPIDALDFNLNKVL